MNEVIVANVGSKPCESLLLKDVIFFSQKFCVVNVFNDCCQRGIFDESIIQES